jgi:hypothetical protein
MIGQQRRQMTKDVAVALSIGSIGLLYWPR